MAQHKHIIINEPGQERNYTSIHMGRGEFSTPPRDRRVHARRLRSDVNQAINDANTQAERTGHVIHDLCLEILGEQDYELKIESLQDLRCPPGNRLEKLVGDREGQYSIRINEQWRICFEWKDGHSYEVEITDYH